MAIKPINRRTLLTGGIMCAGLAAGYNSLGKLTGAEASNLPATKKDSIETQALLQDVQRVKTTAPVVTEETTLSEFIEESNEEEFTSLAGDVLNFKNEIDKEEFEPAQITGLFNKTPQNSQTPSDPGRWFDNLSIEDSMRLIEKIIGIPVDLQKQIIFLESRNDPNATNKLSKACGLKQLMPKTTLPEMLFKYSDMLGFGELGNKIEKYVFAKDKHSRRIYNFRPLKGEALLIRSECYNVWINLSLGAMNLVEKMHRSEELMERSGYKINNYTQADLYIAHFLGARADIMLAYRLNPQKKARSLVNSHVAEQNYSMFYKPNGQARSIGELYKHIDSIGPSCTKKVPAFWRTESKIIDRRMTVAMNTLSMK